MRTVRTRMTSCARPKTRQSRPLRRHPRLHSPASQPRPQPPPLPSARRPPLQPLPDDPSVITDERIGQAITKGVDNLMKAFNPNTALVRNRRHRRCGRRRLPLRARRRFASTPCSRCGQATQDKRLEIHDSFMKSIVDAMKRLPADTGKATYGGGIRATRCRGTTVPRTARPGDRRGLPDHFTRRRRLRLRPPDRRRDAPLGQFQQPVRPARRVVGAETGMKIRPDYWTAVQKHWASKQAVDGTFGYQEPASTPPTLSMTSAGTASLFVTEDYLYADRFAGNVGRDPFTPPLEKAMRWWEKSSGSTGSTRGRVLGLWRVRDRARRPGLRVQILRQTRLVSRTGQPSVGRQGVDGSWGNPIDTSYALLFLSRGRHPILMNKLPRPFRQGGRTARLLGQPPATRPTSRASPRGSSSGRSTGRS